MGTGGSENLQQAMMLGPMGEPGGGPWEPDSSVALKYWAPSRALVKKAPS